MKLCNTADIFKCCASYIQKDFEDWDLKFPEDTPKAEPVITKPRIEDEDNEDESPDKYNRLVSGLIKLLSPKRSECFDNWIKLAWCIINICNKEKTPRRKCYELIHQFSKLATANHNENQVDKWIDKNIDNVNETGYGWNYMIHRFYTCIKEDNPKYYEAMSKSYYTMKNEFEQNNPAILYPPIIIHKDRNGENIKQPIHYASQMLCKGNKQKGRNCL